MTGTKAALDLLCGSASECAITELDIAGAASKDYNEVIQACLDVDNCIGITEWGVGDSQSWRSSSTPTLFDTSFKPKAAYSGLVSLINSS